MLCKGKATSRLGCYVCEKCGNGKQAAKLVASSSKADDQTKRQIDQLRLASNFYANGGFGAFSNDPDHVPAWKKRRRL